MKPTYFLFLDFDGVLIHEKEMLENHNHGFSMTSMHLLKQLITEEDQTVDIKIIISSMHRIGQTLEELKALFQPYGLEDCVVGSTPDLGFAVTRGEEIAKFLETTSIAYEDFVIVDDEDDMVDYVNRLVQTDPAVGLDEEVLERLEEKIARLQQWHAHSTES